MKQRFRLIRRDGGVFYVHDNESGKRASLNTKDRATANSLLLARQEAHRQTFLNLQIARTYAAAADPQFAKRTWGYVIEEVIKTKEGNTRLRWEGAAKDHAVLPLLRLPLLETTAERFLKTLDVGTVSTNVYLRRLHNFALDMNWLLAPVIPKRQWPRVRHKDKRAISREEHRRIVEREPNPEWRAYYELAWHLGASQSDLAGLQAEDIDWGARILSFERIKNRFRNQPSVHVSFGVTLEQILRSRPNAGPLFPKISLLHEKHRAKQFHGCLFVRFYPDRGLSAILRQDSKLSQSRYARLYHYLYPPYRDKKVRISAGEVIQSLKALSPPDAHLTILLGSHEGPSGEPGDELWSQKPASCLAREVLSAIRSGQHAGRFEDLIELVVEVLQTKATLREDLLRGYTTRQRLDAFFESNRMPGLP